MKKLCDAHIHFIPQELAVHTAFYQGTWTDKEKLYAFLDEHHVEKALLAYPSTDAHLHLGNARVCQVYNAAVAHVVKENPRIIAAGLVDLDNADAIQPAVQALKDEGFAALSIASSYDGKFVVRELRPLLEAAQQHRLPVVVHPQTINPIGFDRVQDPLLMPVLEYSLDSSMFLGLLVMENLLEQYEVTFVFSSLGGIVPFLKDRFDRVYTMLRARGLVRDLGKLPSEIMRQVYVDTAGAPLKNIQLAIDLFGEDRLLWGSDYPVVGDIRRDLDSLGRLGQVGEKIAYANFSRVFEP